MTSNMDEFDHDDLGSSDPSTGERQNLGTTLRSKPLFKLLIIMIVIALGVAAALGAFTPAPKNDPSRMVRAPGLNEPPGGQASPFLIEQNKVANTQRAEAALQSGGSALPTPIGQNVDIGDLSATQKKEEALVEFKAETERLKQEMQREKDQNAQQLQALKQQMAQPAAQRRTPQEDQSLVQAMQKQLSQLMNGWAPTNMKIVAGAKEQQETDSRTTAGTAAAESGTIQPASAAVTKGTTEQKALVQAGTVSYAQLLTEANSDIQGPILAQVLSGPLSGARVVGRFQVQRDYLALTFSLATLKGKEYSINAIALDPDTTLSGLATEVDHRYFDRVILPAAGAFVSAFGQAISQPTQTTTVSDGTVIVSQADQSTEDGLLAGLGQAGQTISQFLTQEGSQTKPLVRVAVGTPMGLFFISSVRENSATAGGAESLQAKGGALPQNFPQNFEEAAQQNAAQNPYASPYQNPQTMRGYNQTGRTGVTSMYGGYNSGYNAGTTGIYRGY